mmetsp:Transcript_10677/g.27744  ORF Transcript_10677/g.27744 Transcript_10677/m.27744 type:complete len:247 (+) Transcript_10677:120-860(+)
MERAEESLAPISPRVKRKSAQPALSDMSAEAQLVHLRRAFEVFDANQSNTIDVSELRGLLSNLGITEEEENVQALFEVADADGSGEITFEEFCAVVGAKVVPIEGDANAEMDDAWAIFTAELPEDKRGPDAVITASTLHTVLQHMELGMSYMEAEEMLHVVEIFHGRAATGRITLSEWKAFMRQRLGLDTPEAAAALSSAAAVSTRGPSRSQRKTSSSSAASRAGGTWPSQSGGASADRRDREHRT